MMTQLDYILFWRQGQLVTARFKRSAFQALLSTGSELLTHFKVTSAVKLAYFKLFEQVYVVGMKSALWLRSILFCLTIYTAVGCLRLQIPVAVIISGCSVFAVAEILASCSFSGSLRELRL